MLWDQQKKVLAFHDIEELKALKDASKPDTPVKLPSHGRYCFNLGKNCRDALGFLDYKNILFDEAERLKIYLIYIKESS
jgi:hypothetical protein